ncbi:MAG TPA: sugar transferase, partial [Pseudonocardia sp.]|nr:sugar transferase [Pseudonocardia sp.]
MLLAKPVPTWESVVGRALDLAAAVVALVVLAVPMLLVGVLVRLSSPGPALFAQRRVGVGGRVFTMYKFRTMRAGV